MSSDRTKPIVINDISNETRQTPIALQQMTSVTMTIKRTVGLRTEEGFRGDGKQFENALLPVTLLPGNGCTTLQYQSLKVVYF